MNKLLCCCGITVKIILRSILLLLLQFHPVQVFPSDKPGDYNVISDSIPNKSSHKPLTYNIGLMSGWKAPYGTGADLDIVVHGLLDVNIGLGLSLTGMRTGLGARIYPLKDQRISPMLGSFLTHSSGGGRLSVSHIYDEDGGRGFKINPYYTLEIETGIRTKIDQNLYMVYGFGYSIVLGGSPVILTNGGPNSGSISRLDKFIKGPSTYISVIIKLPE